MNKVLFLVVILFITIKVSARTTIEGYFNDVFWHRFDLHLWTFFSYSNHEIDNKNVQISTSKSECVKGFSISDGKNVEYLPIKVHEVFPNLVGYQAINCSVKEIRYENFEKLNKLQEILLIYNLISYIPDETFKDQANLKYLYLNDNKLQNIDENYFSTLRNLRALILTRNEIEIVSKDAFTSLAELRNVSIAFNNLRTLGDDHFRNNQKLEHIWLYDNKIIFLSPTTFSNMSNLILLNLNDNECINAAFCDRIYTCKWKLSSVQDEIREKC